MQAPQWIAALEPRERTQVMHALNYATSYSSAGIPGHNHVMLIAKLARMLNKAERPQ
jgi:hypothetical protein